MSLGWRTRALLLSPLTTFGHTTSNRSTRLLAQTAGAVSFSWRGQQAVGFKKSAQARCHSTEKRENYLLLHESAQTLSSEISYTEGY